VIAAFGTHQLVALAEVHGNEQFHQFLKGLIEDSRFFAVVDDIVVEFGNARHQETIDRFVRGDDVPYAELRHVWEDTTQPTHVWDLPVYESFFRAVRTANASRPRDHQLRVVIADSPIDWTSVHGRADLQQWANRDRWAADAVEREVVARHHKALIVYGSFHLLRRGRTLLNLLEAEGVGPTFSIWTHFAGDLHKIDSDVASWQPPRLANLKGSSLGAAALRLYVPDAGPNGDTPLEDLVDALLFLGDPKDLTVSHVSAALCRDTAYINMRKQRTTLIQFSFPPAEPFPDWESAFKAACAAK
jgi:hypothetical protein